MPSTVDLARPEGKTLEFTRDLSLPDGALKAIVAFANTAGGTLLAGVEDRTRHVRGVPDALDLAERLTSLVSDRSGPRLVPEIEILPWCRAGGSCARSAPGRRIPEGATSWSREGLRSALAQIEDVLGDLEQRVDAGGIEETRP